VLQANSHLVFPACGSALLVSDQTLFWGLSTPPQVFKQCVNIHNMCMAGDFLKSHRDFVFPLAMTASRNNELTRNRVPQVAVTMGITCGVRSARRECETGWKA